MRLHHGFSERYLVRNPHHHHGIQIRDAGLSIRQRYAGKAVALYDAHGQRRDEYRSLPRLADEKRIVYPAVVPGAEGADVTLWQPRAVA